jgi:hypothetical protein
MVLSHQGFAKAENLFPQLLTRSPVLPGDVISEPNVGEGYTGHVAIVTGDEESTGTSTDGVIKTGDWGFRGIIRGNIWGGRKGEVTVRRNKCK